MRLINNQERFRLQIKLFLLEAPIEPTAILKLHAHASKQVRNAFFQRIV